MRTPIDVVRERDNESIHRSILTMTSQGQFGEIGEFWEVVRILGKTYSRVNT